MARRPIFPQPLSIRMVQRSWPVVPTHNDVDGERVHAHVCVRACGRGGNGPPKPRLKPLHAWVSDFLIKSWPWVLRPGEAGWAEVEHWLWPLFSERWRHLRLQLGLPPLGRQPLRATRLLYGVSAAAIDVPAYWPASVRVCGFWGGNEVIAPLPPNCHH
jgi:hypothetical protein